MRDRLAPAPGDGSVAVEADFVVFEFENVRRRIGVFLERVGEVEHALGPAQLLRLFEDSDGCVETHCDQRANEREVGKLVEVDAESPDAKPAWFSEVGGGDL